ncbi:hypothetical protein MK805_06890 [Shimazuella sp. AN120528]|uniref:hypothetical protein n=1 Tax=Shimazuella soli TaxID=1892854 RepID=UPI001F0E16C0|nr:hypothetical protein [Shimazuella soli]MCH5584696.1 hypothetical protein [Shimazuella soli]
MKEKHTALPSLVTSKSSLLQLIVAGSVNRVKRFWRFLKSVSGYRFSTDYRLLLDHLDQQEEEHVVMQLEETPYLPTILDRKESIVQIESIEGKRITFALLDPLVVEMSGGMVYIHGKSYDIFANLIDKQRNREVVDCRVIDSQEVCPEWN